MQYRYCNATAVSLYTYIDNGIYTHTHILDTYIHTLLLRFRYITDPSVPTTLRARTDKYPEDPADDCLEESAKVQ